MITVTIIVKNGERLISTVLDSLKMFKEVIIYDTGPTDKTIEIAHHYENVRIFERPFSGFGNAHNEAASFANFDWILSIDADEVLSKDLAQEILALHLDSQTVYALPFHNFFNGKHIKWCGWYPESHVRLYHRKKTKFSNVQVHEGVETKGFKQKALRHPVYHYSYHSLSDFLIKMERYSTLFAEQYKGKRRSSPFIAIIHGLTAFIKSFFIKRGFLGGFEGFLISIYNAHTAFYKYLNLYYANRRF